MAVSTPTRKPLGVRVTVEQHRLLIEAAKREHRSVSSFVLNSALTAARQESSPGRSAEEIDAAIRRVQELMSPYREEGRSLVDELIAERRAEAARE